jgi:metal-sulfur cluster biosynthetic enzyme
MSTSTNTTTHDTQFDIGPPDEPTGFERELWDALDEIPDPHIPVSLVEMAMIYDVHVDGSAVTVEMSYPCLGCPAYDMIQNDIESCLCVLDGVEDVTVEVVWDPVWSKEMLTENARHELKNAGIGL